MKNLKVTQLMLARGFGGAERHFTDLSLALADRGYQIQAICHPEFSHRAVLQAHSNIEVVVIKARGHWDLWSAHLIKKHIARFRPCTVHTHLARGAHLGGKAANALGIPSIANLHNYVNLKYYRNIDLFIAATADQESYLLRQGVAKSDVIVIPHFSMLAAISPTLITDGVPLRFVALGRLVKKKGFDLLIRAFVKFLDAGWDARLLIGGDGPERANLETIVAQSSAAEKIKFHGWIQDIPHFLSQGDVFVLPSRDEPFGIVVLEAMGSGKSIICTKTLGPLAILDEESAYFTDIDDAQSITKSMLELASDKVGAFNKAEVASSLFRSNYNADAVVPKVERIYEAGQALLSNRN